MARARASTLWRTQNLLRDPRLAEHLVASSGIGPSDTVFDLGAGRGALTAALAAHAQRVIALEKDPALVGHLRRRFRGHSNTVVLQADIRTYPLPQGDYVVFASPPFDITSLVMRKLTTATVPPREARLVLQREAAERYVGSPAQTFAALQIAPWFAVDVVHRFKRTDFVPAPAVDVVLLRVRKRGPPLVASDAHFYRDFIAEIFTAWQPNIGSSLVHAVGTRAARRLLEACRVDPTLKPSEVSLADWLTLYQRFAQLDSSLRARVVGAELRLRRQQAQLTKRHRTRAPRDGLPPMAYDLGLRPRQLEPRTYSEIVDEMSSAAEPTPAWSLRLVRSRITS